MKAGIIGAGAIVRRGHLPAIKAMKNIEIGGIADVSESSLQKINEEFHISRTETNYKELLDDKSIDIVIICTPPETHSQMIIDAAEAGKHILVEKPMAASLKDAVAIYKKVHETKVKLSVVQNYRYFPAVLKVKQRISNGHIGNIISLNGHALARFPSSWTRNTWIYNLPGAVLYDFAPHLIDMILWIVDSRPIRVCSLGGNYLTDGADFFNYSQIMLEFENGAVACADTSWLTGTNMFLLDFHGSTGHIFLDVRSNYFSEIHGTPTPFDDIRRFRNSISAAIKGVLNGSFFKGPLAYLKPLIQDFVNTIEHNTSPMVSEKEGLLTIAVLEAANISMKERRFVDINTLLQDHGVELNLIDRT